jgi:hypothetical protein
MEEEWRMGVRSGGRIGQVYREGKKKGKKANFGPQ